MDLEFLYKNSSQRKSADRKEAFGTSVGLWMNLQNQYDTWHAKKQFHGKVSDAFMSRLRPRQIRKKASYLKWQLKQAFLMKK